MRLHGKVREPFDDGLEHVHLHELLEALHAKPVKPVDDRDDNFIEEGVHRFELGGDFRAEMPDNHENQNGNQADSGSMDNLDDGPRHASGDMATRRRNHLGSSGEATVRFAGALGIGRAGELLAGGLFVHGVILLFCHYGARGVSDHVVAGAVSGNRTRGDGCEATGLVGLGVHGVDSFFPYISHLHFTNPR